MVFNEADNALISDIATRNAISDVAIMRGTLNILRELQRLGITNFVRVATGTVEEPEITRLMLPFDLSSPRADSSEDIQ